MTAQPAPARGFSVRRLGREGQPLVVIDDYAPDPHSLVALAQSLPWTAPTRFYPGIRAEAPKALYRPLIAPIADVLRQIFGYPPGAQVESCSFSLVTKRPEDLAPIQRLPHFDGTGPGKIAVLLYLCAPEHGGTAFYRHRTTGFETVSAERFDHYRQTLEREAAQRGVAPGYICGSTETFEEIDRVEAAFNRVAIYRGVTLHSGLIPANASFSADPAIGRLTLNAFLEPQGPPPA